METSQEAMAAEMVQERDPGQDQALAKCGQPRARQQIP
jgi:hypothetical protein